MRDGVTRASEWKDGAMEEEQATKIMDEGQKGNVYMTTWERERGGPRGFKPASLPSGTEPLW